MAKTSQIEYVAELIRKLVVQDTAQQEDITSYTSVLSKEEETLLLDQTESDQYTDVLDHLVTQFGKAENISRRTIEETLQRAIFFAIDISKKHQEQSLEERIKTATTELRDTLSQPAKSYECYVPIKGIHPEGLPYRFGSVTFLHFKEHQLRKFSQALRHHEVSDKQMEIRKHLLKDMRQSATWNSPCARIEVKAKDFDAALILAHRQVRVTIDSINFFSDLVPYNYGWLYFPEEATSVSVMSPVLREDHTFSLLSNRKGPFPSFSFKKLKETQRLRPLLKRVDQLLRREPQRDIDQLLLSAVQWAGRASVEPRREESFLLFAIALESIVLPTSDSRELSYRLQIRTAHLLESTVEGRSRVIEEVKKLYRIRSKIVHNGHYQVTDEERMHIRLIVKRVIFAILVNKSVAKLDSRENLNDWFENKILS